MRPHVVAALVVLSAAAGFLAGQGWGRRSSAPTPVEAGAIVARWTGGELSAAGLRQRLLSKKQAAGITALDAQRARSFADDVLRSEVLAQEARRRGLLQDPKAAGAISEALAHRLVEIAFEEKKGNIDDAAVSTWYGAHHAELERPERVRVSHLYLAAAEADASARKKRRSEIDGLKKQLEAAGADDIPFAERAKATSDDDKSRSAGGDLGALTKEELEARLGPGVARAGWLLVRIGEVSPVLETADGFHLLRLAGREGAVQVQFEAVKERIRSRLWYERRDEEIRKFVAGLESSLGLSVDRAALDAVLAEVAAK